MEREIALITGSTSGIGAATAELFADQGYHVVITGRDAEHGRQVCERIEDKGGTANFYAYDLMEYGTAESLAAHAAELGKLAALINCAGGNKPGMTVDDHIAINYKAARAVTLATLKHMSTGASIITVTSICSESKQAHEGGPYSDAKAALTSFSNGLVADLAKRNIRINIVAPGLTDTRDTAHITKDERAALIEKMPMTDAFLEPATVAQVIYDLHNWPVTGQTIVVDGGMTAIHG